MPRVNNILAFDCSTAGCSAVVLSGTRVLARGEAAPNTRQAEELMPLIARVMDGSGLRHDALEMIAVTVGPGSFTGIRLGLAAARGLALALGIEVAGVTTPEALACSIPAGELSGRPILVAIDSKRAELFVQPFDSSERRSLAPIAALPPEEAAHLLPEPPILVGDGAARLLPLIPGAILSSVTNPDPLALALVARQRFEEGRARPPEPLYLRPADVTLPGAPR